MSVTIKEMVPSALPPALPRASLDPALDPALAAAITEAAQLAAKAASDAAHITAKTLINQALASVEAKLAAIEAPRAQVMAVEINGGETRKLKSAASPILADLISNAKIGLNTLLVGPAGCGKSFACAQAAEAMGLEYEHVVLTSGASETWLFGRQTPTGFMEGPLPRRYRLGGVFCFEELDAADANLLMSVNVALENGHMYNPINGELITRHPDFVAIATANTVGKGGDHVYTARNRLDASSLRRWDKLAVDYDAGVEKSLCPDATLYKLFQKARTRLRELKSDEILSTGCLEKAYRKLAAGFEPIKILKSLTLGWPEEIVSQCGLDSWPEETTRLEPIREAIAPSVGSQVPPAIASKIAANDQRIEELKRKLSQVGQS